MPHSRPGGEPPDEPADADDPDRQDALANQIDALSDQRSDLDGKLASVSIRLRELAHMERVVEEGGLDEPNPAPSPE